MKKRLFAGFLIYAFMTVYFMSFSVCANAAQTYQNIETDRKCSLRLTYSSQDKLFEGLEIQIFHAADVSEDKEYTLSRDFEGCPVNIDAVSSQSEWDSIASTLTAYAFADSVSPAQEKTTDKNGVVKFSDLSVGLYLVRWTKNKTADDVSGFEPFIISVPDLNDDGSWNYDINAIPKPGRYSPTKKEIEFRAVVLWNDEMFEKNRPDNVQIEVFKNGKSIRKYTVSSKENWTVRWKALDDGSVWTVVERDLGTKYYITVSEYGNVFTIINHYKEDNSQSEINDNSGTSSDPGSDEHTSPLKTGDAPEIGFYVCIVLILSASLTVILTVCKRGESND